MRCFHRAVLLAIGIAVAIAPAAAADTGVTGTLKKTVAVDPFLAAESVGGTVTADGMTAMLINALVKDGRFVVVERPGFASITVEQNLGTSGATTAETAAKTNQLIGANIIIRATVTKFEANANGGGVQVGNFGMSRFLGSTAGAKAQQAVIEISLRLIDAVTGQVIATSTANGSASSMSANASVSDPRTGTTLDAGAFHNTPIGEAGQDAINKAVQKIFDGSQGVAWSALVVDASGTKVYVNAGADRNVQPGLVLAVYHKGKAFTDPATGEVLDVEMEKVGTVRIDGVRPKLSTAVVVDGAVPARGDVLRLQ